MARAPRGERYDNILHESRQEHAVSRATRTLAAAREPDRDADGHPTTKPGGPIIGSSRHTLTVLGQLVPIALVLGALVGGLQGLAATTLLLGVAALITARYVAGAGSAGSTYRRGVRLMGTQDPSLADWRWTVRNGLDPKDSPHPLRPRLRRLYAARLAEQHSVSLATEPERAAALVGPEVWPWLDPQAPDAGDVLSPAVLTLLIDRLETL
ncbi:hypothetical protein OG455_08250 [Kitasatospora sp. NBC_01287]|uniref:hypothetical protein n=1 Tax=Kitasatospora sp. NBC_01287 TaxID=2903573 RepID=UPI0022558A46|nr:hypothetical protein [Kitasatospora sp. NBC_01287]MCX4745513.1 hypothetical protein [Kitasatospora sp. NBC_01287]